jgi:hypothetical protein
MAAQQPATFPREEFYEDFQEKVILPLMKISEARLASSPGDLDHVAAFMIGRYFPSMSVLHLHFAYTRLEFRRLGLQRELMRGLGWKDGDKIIATHWTKDLHQGPLRGKLVYNPYSLYRIEK